jgi:hypothetical protein
LLKPEGDELRAAIGKGAFTVQRIKIKYTPHRKWA